MACQPRVLVKNAGHTIDYRTLSFCPTAPQVAFCFGDGIPEEDDYDDDFGDYDYEEGQESE